MPDLQDPAAVGPAAGAAGGFVSSVIRHLLEYQHNPRILVGEGVLVGGGHRSGGGGESTGTRFAESPPEGGSQ